MTNIFYILLIILIFIYYNYTILQSTFIIYLHNSNTIKFIKGISLNNTILSIVVTEHYIDEAINFYLLSILKLKITNYVFISIDLNSYYSLKEYTYNTFFYNRVKIDNGSTAFSTNNFRIITMIKTYVLMHLMKLKQNVFVCDVDVHLFQNPLPLFLSYNTDIVASTDSKYEMNTGLLYDL